MKTEFWNKQLGDRWSAVLADHLSPSMLIS